MFEIVALFYFALRIAAAQIASDECVVGEAVTNPPTSPCSIGDAECEQFCRQKLGTRSITDYKGARCSEPRGASGTRECLCTAKCARAGCWEEPSCNTFDRIFFSYHGLCKHTLVRPSRPLQSVPNFEVRLTNRRWMSSSTAVPDVIELIIPQWDAKVEIQNGILKVNGKVESTPYRMERYVDDYKLIGFNVTRPLSVFGPSVSSELNVQTSFGVTVNTDMKLGSMSNGVYVYLPRLPELRGNVEGLLGRWDDDQSNDFIGGDSIKRNNLKQSDQTLFGDSWCVVKTRSSMKSMRRIKEDIEIRQKDLNKCREDDKKKPAMEICQQLREPKFANCAKQRRSAEQMIAECELNVCYAGVNADNEMAANNFIDALAELCAA